MQLHERALAVTLVVLSLVTLFLIFSPGAGPETTCPSSLSGGPYSTACQESRSGKIEGHISSHQASYYTSLGQLPFVRTVCEIGFNGGHSAIMWLTSNPDLHLYAFDLGLHSYARTAQNWIDRHFPGRLTLTLGDSVETVPAFARDHPELVCDVLHIDGGHFYGVPLADLRNMRRMAARPTHLVLIDDVVCPHVWCEARQRAWDQMKAEHAIEEWECVSSGEGNKGWCAGRYTPL